ncbi:hypothetical protein Tco_0320763 [Tanacetum coccineum]
MKLESTRTTLLENLKQLDINIPFIEALVQIPKYAKNLKSLLTNKSKLEEACMKTMNERCSTILLNKLPIKEKDPTSFTNPGQVLEKHKEAEDLSADHSSRLENPHMEVLTERKIADEFFDEHLMVLKSKSKDDEPCYDDTRNGNGEHNNSRMITTPKLKISDEFLKILEDNAFNGMDEGEVTDHIAKEAKDIYEVIKREYSPIPIPAHHDIDNPNELCRIEEFIVVRHSIGNDEEFVIVGPSKINTVERTPGSMTCIYYELFNRKDHGWEELAETMIWYMMKKTCVELIRAF